ncbi:MAG: glycosyltransferase [Elusimicrobia bacterium]|nr:glycosyltransferase [Elusimicrobiota bacterium]
MREGPALSVVVPAFNEEGYLGPLLDSLERARERLARERGKTAEVIVVDNASTDGTAALARARGARVVFEPHRQIAAARNAGVRAAVGEIVATCDADNVVSDNLLVRIDEEMADPRAVGGGVRILPERQRWDTDLLFWFFDRAALILGTSFGVLFARRETFERIGGFPTEIYVGEDAFFVLGLKREARRRRGKFVSIRDAFIRTSLRKIDQFGFGNILWQHVKFLFAPWRLRRREAARTWYDVRK